MRVLVVYYSLTGTTRAVAAALARELGADIEGLLCPRYEPGASGSIRAAWDSWRGYLPPVQPLVHDLADYGLVVVAGPIWAFHPATPVRAFLRQAAPRLHNVAFVLTHGGSAGQRSLREMAAMAVRPPVATLVVREAAVKRGRFAEAVAQFAASLRVVQAA